MLLKELLRCSTGINTRLRMHASNRGAAAQLLPVQAHLSDTINSGRKEQKNIRTRKGTGEASFQCRDWAEVRNVFIFQYFYCFHKLYIIYPPLARVRWSWGRREDDRTPPAGYDRHGIRMPACLRMKGEHVRKKDSK
jgi:hypothetical protein